MSENQVDKSFNTYIYIYIDIIKFAQKPKW